VLGCSGVIVAPHQEVAAKGSLVADYVADGRRLFQFHGAGFRVVCSISLRNAARSAGDRSSGARAAAFAIMFIQAGLLRLGWPLLSTQIKTVSPLLPTGNRRCSGIVCPF